LRREWGAVTFVLTVLVGMIVVPLALLLANQGPGPITIPSSPTVTSATASAAQTASPVRTTPSP